ncbi:hypothetical protein HRR83_001945 [Exophiala dermatitidis]|uniref:Mitochondrial protein n=2 Tax=Exophiala dermatitidis TaxID=5970 RepID=H6BZC5_EXODN|nr:uncharacterized protein HMPREF1120_05044 [Exophiala dermatitidis NIH/UT8656]KAJ4514405.1 hypothetical protein HRR73_005433 [Exophiala dermatitidis]EHY56988.1 hypothetical protein HMPREF1120_05044 [Exophiala dermatitidis NIH/UT8656]KAJ4519994.1 hypothetical protein HRR75_001855 [Exophiala dermatitidis]KAJ4523829.1 hypothetical protein HRR74_002022 [Exophiala dermatitidis]KAJ4537232.1 hypothetical protein HRR76_005246 [Exophiala dermatitidis]
MATTRLPFLYPNFFRAVRACEPTTYHSIRAPPANNAQSARKARLHTSVRRQQDAVPQRYGPAASESHLPPPQKPSDSSKPAKKEGQDSLQGQQQAGKSQDSSSSSASQQPAAKKSEPKEESIGQDEPQQSNSESDYIDEASLVSKNHKIKPEEQGPLENKELDMVLSMPSPSDMKKNKDPSRHPHLEPPPYEHHFDTYGLVQQLAAKNAYTVDQAITLMKAIRRMLSVNLDMAKEGLVSKSDIENESYLFRAACSELKTTLQTTRHSETLKQRSQRAQLQHEFDILNQKVTQDLMTLREELKGLFNDRKLRLQEDKRKIDSKISELNYEITVLLNSEAKSEVEGLRWVLTRRAAMAIGFCAFMIISALNYSSIKMREKEEAEKKRKAAAKAMEERVEARYSTPSRAQSTQTDEAKPPVNYEESLG